MKRRRPAPKKAQKRRPSARARRQTRHTENLLDDALAGTFPASDPVSLTEPAPKNEPSQPK